MSEKLFSDEQMELLIKVITEVVDKTIKPLIDRLDKKIDDRLDKIDDRLDKIGNRFDALELTVSVIGNNVKYLSATTRNALIGANDPIVIVPLPNGDNPKSKYPATIYSLVVADNETLPDGSQNTWNAINSLNLIKEYDPGYETDIMSDNTTVLETSSRKRRLKLMKCLGITAYQINIATTAYYL